MKSVQQILQSKKAYLERFEAAMHRAGLNTPAYIEYASLCDKIREEIRQLCQYFSVFASDDFLAAYLILRENGDTHLVALETINGERQMARLCHKF